jgi:hypothetical protein
MKAFEPSSIAAARLGPKVLMPAASSRSTRPATSGASGPTTTKSMALGRRQGDDRVEVVEVDRQAGRDLGDAGVAGGAIEPIAQGRGGDRPAERVLAPTRTDDKKAHGSSRLVAGPGARPDVAARRALL